MNLFHEIRFGFRQLLKNPVSSAAAILAMALGIGLAVSMFAVIDGSVLRGLPFEDSDELYHLEELNLRTSPSSSRVSLHDFKAWREQQRSFEDLAGLDPVTVNLSDDHLPERYKGVRVSTSFLDLLRVRPILGQGFHPADEAVGAPPVILIAHHIWQQRYEGDPDIVGRVVRVNAVPTTVVGVLPPGFRFPFRQDVWLPLQLNLDDVPRGQGARIGVFGRLRDGIPVERAAAEMSAIARRLQEQFPETNDGIDAGILPYIDAFIDRRAQLLLGVMLTATLFVLLIASINVANLLIARAAARGHEFAIRASLGASPWRALRQVLLGEAGLLAVLGALGGLVLAQLAIFTLASVIAEMDPPFWVKFQLDGRAVLFALIATVLAILVAGIGPAWQASRSDLNRLLQDSSRGASAFRVGWLIRILVVFQLAISFPLLVGAGLMVRTVESIHDYDLHLDPEHVLTARVAFSQGDYPTHQDRISFYQRLLERVGAQPGVVSAGVGSLLPLDTSSQVMIRYLRFGREYGSATDMPIAHFVQMTPSFLDTLAVPLLHGRRFSEADRAGAPRVALVSEALARREWPGEEAVGKRLREWTSWDDLGGPDGDWLEVVGVIPNLHFGDFDNQGDAPAIYVPMAQSPAFAAWIVVRTGTGDPLTFTENLRQTVRDLDPNLPLFEIRPMHEVLSRAMFFPKLLGVMFGIFGVVAVLLAAIGLYGVLAFGATQRTREMGIRMAFGGTRRRLLLLILRQNLVQVVVGLVLGMVLAVPLAFALASFIFRLAPMDPSTFVLTSLLFLLVAAIACLVPATRITSIDPSAALRYD